MNDVHVHPHPPANKQMNDAMNGNVQTRDQTDGHVWQTATILYRQMSNYGKPSHRLTLQINNFCLDDIVGVRDLLLENAVLAGQCHDPALLLTRHHHELLVEHLGTSILTARQCRTRFCDPRGGP